MFPGDLFQLYFLVGIIPGVLTQIFVNSCITREKMSDFQRFLEIVVFTLISFVVYLIINNFGFNLINETKEIKNVKDLVNAINIPNYILLLLIGIALGWIIALMLKNKWFYKLFYFGKLRELHNNKKCKIINWLRHISPTNLTGNLDVWHDIFDNMRRVWLRIYMKDGTVIVGWPLNYSEMPEQRELLLKDVTIYRENYKDKHTEMIYLCDVEDIKYIEIRTDE